MDNICQAMTKNGTRCTRKTKHGNFCGMHHKMVIPNEPEEEGIISFKIVDPHGREVGFKTRTDIPFSKVFATYCEKQALAVNLLSFSFDGVHIPQDCTPELLGLKNGCSIFAALVDNR